MWAPGVRTRGEAFHHVDDVVLALLADTPAPRVVEGRFGALRVDVDGRAARFRYQTVDGRVRDDFRLRCS